MKLGYKVIKERIKTIILIFSVPNSQNSYEEEKNSITAKTYVSNHGDTNILTGER